MMPLWLARIVAFVLFVAIMAALTVVLKAWVPGFSDWLGQRFGQSVATVGVLLFFALCGVYGLWPRDADGRMRPLLSRRR